MVVVDEFSGRLADILKMAEALAPYPPLQGNYYPGLRRIIDEDDEKAHPYSLAACATAAPFLGGAFDVASFDLDEASFSKVKHPPRLAVRTKRVVEAGTLQPYACN